MLFLVQDILLPSWKISKMLPVIVDAARLEDDIVNDYCDSAGACPEGANGPRPPPPPLRI